MIIEHLDSYDLFMREVKQEIENKKRVFLYYDYQVKEIEREFGDRIEMRYSERHNWWFCELKGIKIECVKKKKNKKRKKEVKVKEQENKDINKVENRGRKKGYNLRDDVNAQDMFELKKEGYTIQGLANKYNCGKSTIVRRLKEYNESLL